MATSESQILFPPAQIARILAHAEKPNAVNDISREIAERLIDRLFDLKRDFRSVLDASLPNSHLASICAEHGLLFDGYTLHQFKDTLQPEEHSYDLVLSHMALPWMNNPRDFLLKLGKSLKADGLLLASMLGSESFKEFQEAFKVVGSGTPHTIPLPDVKDIGGLMQQLKFALPVVDRDVITLSYPNFESLYQDLKNHGAFNLHPLRSKGLTGKKQWQRMEDVYREKFALEDGSLPLTIEVIYLSGWRPHKSQQQPLERGSAKVNLSEVV